MTTPRPGIPRASVIVPTHRHAATLPVSVRTALRQSVEDLEILIVGDGVDEATRNAALMLADLDRRVRWLDFPKGPHHGELHRHEAVLMARSEAIFYLCDDDLLLPTHVADLLTLLTGADLVQSRNGYIDPFGRFVPYLTDLSDPAAVQWHLDPVPRNRVSLTGTAHRRSAYLRLPSGWETTPAGQWPDHFMWKKFFAAPGFRGATSRHVTALQFPSHHERADWNDETRLRELAPWAELVASAKGQSIVDQLVDQGTTTFAIGLQHRITHLEQQQRTAEPEGRA